MITSAARETARISYLITGILLILLALFTVAARVGLPLVATYKNYMESQVSEYLRSPVEIGDLSLRWEGFGPLLRAKDVSVFETTERLVTLDEILIDINLAKSLLRGLPIINELSLVGANLAIEADSDGQVRLHGMEWVRSESATNDVIDVQKQSDGVDVVAWLFNARKVGLLDTQLTLIDLKAGSQVEFANLNIRVENDGNMHQLRVDANLPESLGGRLEAGIDLVGNPRTLSTTNGELYLSAESIDLSGLRDLLLLGGFMAEDLPEPLTLDAMASVELWGEWKDGQIVSARGPVKFESIKNAVSHELLLDSASAHLQLTRAGESMDLSVTDLQTTQGSVTLEMEEFRLRNTASTRQFSVAATELPAETVARFATLALASSQPDFAQALANSATEGSIRNFELTFTDDKDAPVIDLIADVDSFSFEGNSKLPAFGPMSGKLALSDSTGQLTLSAQQMPLSWSELNDEQLQLDSLQATIDIDVRNWQKVLLGADIQLADNGIDTSTRVMATFASDTSPHLDIQSRFTAADITELKAWLPRKQLGAAAISWIERAITAGEATDGSLLMFGKVSDFPFEQGDGVFRASVDINDGTLAFLPGWPAASNINGSLELDGFKVTGVAENSTLDKFTVSQTQVTIGNLAAPVVELSSTTSGSFQDAVDFGITGPLKSFLEPAIGDLSGTGVTQMDLSLEYPLFGKPKETDTGLRARLWRSFSIDGSLFLANNDVTFGRAELVLDNAQGAVSFDDNGIAISTLVGQVLGHDVRVSGSTEGQGAAATTTVTIKGAIEANDLLAHYGNPLDQFIRGASQWSATISAPHSINRINRDGVTLDINSDLVGAELLLPAPFDKGTSSTRMFSLSTAFRDSADDQFWEARYGDELRAHVRVVDQDMESLLIELGQAQLSDTSTSLSQPGIRLQGYVPQLAADGWIETIAQYIDSFAQSEGEPELILPVSVKLDTDALILGRRSLGEATLQANTDEIYLNLAVVNQALKGNMRYPRKHWEKDTALKARVDLLDWSVIDALSEEIEPTPGSVQSSGELDPRLLPPVEARVSLLTKDNIRIRDLVLRAQPNVSGLDITTLGFAYETMRMVGQGHWYLRDPQNVGTGLTDKHVTQLNLVLQSDDFGVGLDEIGLTGMIDDAQGSIEMKLNWPGPLYKPEIANLDGDITVDMRSGSVVPLEPGAGRMVGFFAFQALPRRLNFDFKDMTGAGLAFESIAGSVDIDNGIAEVPLLQLKGPIGVVDIAGTSDLNTQQFDQQVTVLPRVSAALPIIGAISGGASAGIGALVAAGLLKALGIDFDRLGLRTYKLTGDWSDPEFTSVPTDYLRRRQ